MINGLTVTFESGVSESFPAASVAWPLRQDGHGDLKGDKFQFHDSSCCIAHLSELLVSRVSAKSAQSKREKLPRLCRICFE